MSLVIRKAEKADVGLILDFIRALAIYEKLGDEVVATPQLLEETLFGATPRAHVLIGEWDGAPCGFALYFFNYSTFLGRPGLYLEDLFVDEAFRGKGIGKAFFARLADIARENECGRMEWQVLDWNAPSIAFYKSLGASPMDAWKVFRLTGGALDRLAGAA